MTDNKNQPINYDYWISKDCRSEFIPNNRKGRRMRKKRGL